MSQEHIQERDIRHKLLIEEKKYGNLVGLTTVEVNVTELCNRKCVFCPRHDPTKYPNRKLHIDERTVRRLIDQLKQNNYKGAIHISGFGEPLLNPEILDYIILIKKELGDTYVELTTNGDFLTIEKIKKIESVVDRIVVDCYDGEDQALTRQLMFNSIGFNKYYLRRLWFDEEKEKIDSKIQEWNFNNRAGAVTNIEFKLEQRQCFIPFYRITVDWNGNIVLCCNDWYRQQNDLGNIHDTPLYDLWFSEHLNNIRRNLARGCRIDKACKNCSANGTLFGKSSFDIVNQHQNLI